VGSSAESFRSATAWSLAGGGCRLSTEIRFEFTVLRKHRCRHLHLHHTVIALAAKSLGRRNGDDRQLRIYFAFVDDIREAVDSMVETRR